MEIDINQKKVSIGDKYQVFVDGQPTYFASRQLSKFLPLIQLCKINGGDIRITLEKKLSWIKPTFDIKRWDNNILELKTVSFFKNHYLCQCGDVSYNIYGHRGRKYSVYKNDNQIAWWDKNAVSWFGGDKYKIIADNDSDPELIISFCLIIDNVSSDKNKGKMVTFSLGNIGQAKAFDKLWQPKY